MDAKKQLNFTINAEIHKKLKVLAAQRNITLNVLITRAIADYMKKEARHDAKNELHDL